VAGQVCLAQLTAESTLADFD